MPRQRKQNMRKQNKRKQNMRKQGATIDAADGAISHKDKSADVLEWRQEQGAKQAGAQVHVSISPLVTASADADGPKPSSSIGQSARAESSHDSTDELRSCSADSFRYSLDLNATAGPDLGNLRGHTSGSGDDKCDDSAYLASNSQSIGYDDSASFTRQGSGGTDDTHNGSADQYRCDLTDSCQGGLIWSVDGGSTDSAYSLRSGGADERHPSYDAIKAQADETLDERAHAHLLEVLRLDGIVRQMRDERSRELERLCGKAPLEEALDEAGAAPSPQIFEQVRSTTGDVCQAFPVKRKRALRLLPRSARTLIVRNVPWTYSQEDLLLVWPPDGTYDYLHTPYHFFNDRTVGHAYINFITYEAAAAFQERWHGRYLPQRDTKNTLDISVATVQGRGPILARIAEDRIPVLVEKHFLPMLLDGERRLCTHEVLAEWRRSRPSGENEPGVGAFGAWH